MRTKLGRVAVIVTLGASLVVATVAADDAEATVVESTVVPSTTAAPTADAAAVTSAPTPTTGPLVAEVSGAVTPSRGTQAQVTETVPPPPSTTLPDPLALPADSGSGRRIVYSKSAQRVWVVEADETVSKTHLVSGRRTWNQPLPGTYSVFSRSSFTCNIKNPSICWRYMVRFTRGPEGDNIGLHEIPKRNGVPVQTIAQLGTPLSGGCVRQATPDAIYIWDWAPVGTKVVVLG
jgi:lipoprotein-anchoring transpeptidase ErfK/SrfK